MGTRAQYCLLTSVSSVRNFSYEIWQRCIFVSIDCGVCHCSSNDTPLFLRSRAFAPQHVSCCVMCSRATGILETAHSINEPLIPM